MTREIKFRAWYFNQILDWEHIMAHLDLHKVFDDKDMKLMQFTGLLDKNGKEIYEGDIVKRTYNEYSENFEVKYFSDDGYPAFDLDDIHGYLCDSESNLLSEAIGAGEDIELEIIGNIYENPELIK